jgi:hypothetical protein
LAVGAKTGDSNEKNNSENDSDVKDVPAELSPEALEDFVKDLTSDTYNLG